MKNPIIIITIIIITVYLWVSETEVALGYGILAPDVPLQEKVNTPPFTFLDYQVFPQASFNITAKVLSKEKYYVDKGADIIGIPKRPLYL